jgi:hypothetical protein
MAGSSTPTADADFAHMAWWYLRGQPASEKGRYVNPEPANGRVFTQGAKSKALQFLTGAQVLNYNPQVLKYLRYERNKRLFSAMGSADKKMNQRNP